MTGLQSGFLGNCEHCLSVEDCLLSLSKIVSIDSKVFIDGNSFFPYSSYKFALQIMLQQMHVKIQMEATKALPRKVIVPEGHSMKAE